ncbi:hypothetical protein GQ53DRAFT_809091 [Thozetella sp. PMI_491]|nr:hypothetical protein GQ53DRAFT_809091 [Thozetella sp. PMI_491]
MVFRSALGVVLWALVSGVVGIEGLHLATEGLLQFHPSFVGDGITLLPGHAHDHVPTDLVHLTPEPRKELYYSQEGHRPAFHGAKHGTLKANFKLAAVVLDQSTHPWSVECPDDGTITVCFPRRAFKHVTKAWDLPEFYISTFHINCGDEYSGQRSYFHATNPRFDMATGTRVPVKGHVRLTKPFAAYAGEDQGRLGNSNRIVSRGQDDKEPDKNHLRPSAVDSSGKPENSAQTSLFTGGGLENYLGGDPAPERNEKLDEILGDSKIFTGNNNDKGNSNLQHRGLSSDESGLGIFSFFSDIIATITTAVGKLGSAILGVVIGIAKVIVTIAVISAKAVLVLFGVPFEHTYEQDIKFGFELLPKDPPPPEKHIAGYEDGYTILETRGKLSLLCLKCGVNVDFSIEGRLAFTIKDGVTEGKISLQNNEDFTIDAIFGLKIEGEADSPVGPSKQLKSLPLSPLAIPGIITLGPQLTLGIALDIGVHGNASIALGGSLRISKGSATIDAKDSRKSGIVGLETNFTKVAKFEGDAGFRAVVGLPIALEVGVDILNGRAKLTVGLVNQPGIFAKATKTGLAHEKCPNAVQLNLGVSNQIFVSIFGATAHEIRDDTIYEQEIACINIPEKEESKSPRSENDIIRDAKYTAKHDVSRDKPHIDNVAANITTPPKQFGYRVIMAEDKGSVLASGKDEYIYLVPEKQHYDASAPIGSGNLTTGLFDVDIHQRVMAYRPDGHQGYAAAVTFWNATMIPMDEKAAFIKLLSKDDGKPKKKGERLYYGLEFKDQSAVVYFPTFCKTNKGTRLYGTQFAMKDEGATESNPFESHDTRLGVTRGVDKDNKFVTGEKFDDLIKGLEKMGVEKPKLNCETVRLTSDLTEEPTKSKRWMM